jgi:hypothetical protein
VPVQHSSTSSAVACELTGWLRSYQRSPVVSGKGIRAILDADKELFYPPAFRELRCFDGSVGAVFLAGLMLERGLLLRALCEPAMPEQRVREVIQAVMTLDAANDLALVKAVVENAQGQQPQGGCKALLRVLNNVERLADARRVAPRLLPLLRHPDPKLRSKVVRIIGRCGKNTQWVARQLADPDPRTRANAIEALWGSDDKESRDLLKHAALDQNNRTAGNALLGLYRSGESSSIGDLLRMGTLGDALFRLSAAWAMGESGDPRFHDAVKALANDKDPQVRKRAELSLARLEAEAAKPELGLPWRTAVFRDPLECEASGKRLRVTVQCADGTEPPPIIPTQFSILEDDQPVLDYGVEPLEVPPKLVFAFLIPVLQDGPEIPIVSAALRTLAWKRPQDAWAAIRYKPPRRWNLTATLIGEVIEIAPPEEAFVPVDLPVFVADDESAAEAIQHVPEGPIHGCIWDAVVETVRACASLAARDVQPHVVIYNPLDAGVPPEHQVERLAALDLAVRIHCIAGVADPFLQGLCDRSNGTYHVAARDAEVVETLERLYVRLLARYLVTYQGAEDATRSYVQVRTPEGWAKSAVHLARE